MASEWAIQAANSARERIKSLNKNSKVEIVEPLEIFHRDSWTCQICYKPISPKSIDPFDPQRVTLDHRLPIVLGGASYKNEPTSLHT